MTYQRPQHTSWETYIQNLNINIKAVKREVQNVFDNETAISQLQENILITILIMLI